MQKMKLYLDTHNVENNTFPEDISLDEFSGFYEQYKDACNEEGVVPLNIFTGVEAGRAFCLTLAESSDAVERAHNRVSLPFDSITEVKSVTPGDLFFSATA
ncbi:nickel-binding protein [Neptuniibacter sp.]|uniref:nickel-binding protein n=1 Tax=Neptuniibacter sp. TaxID=1962643 RepID=UPI002610DC0B|nr:nickel-binding protein [Neptuniibacter sp.]MCP4598259.1 DUF4242 domain-containing protein [Neptuniibacter sp.]